MLTNLYYDNYILLTKLFVVFFIVCWMLFSVLVHFDFMFQTEGSLGLLVQPSPSPHKIDHQSQVVSFVPLFLDSPLIPVELFVLLFVNGVTVAKVVRIPASFPLYIRLPLDC